MNVSIKKTTRSIGSQYEIMAKNYLCEQGLTLVEKNYICPLGEIDIIMLDGTTLIFIEVRYRNATQYGSSIETVTRSKQKKILLTAEFFLKNHLKYQHLSCRCDVIGIDRTHDGELTLNWIKNAFME